MCMFFSIIRTLQNFFSENSAKATAVSRLHANTFSANKTLA